MFSDNYATESETIASTLHLSKKRLARLLAHTPITSMAEALEDRLGLIRVLAFHSVPEEYAGAFGEILDYLGNRYRIGDPFDLEDILAAGPSHRPIAFITLDDGITNHATVAARSLEARGMRGIFSIPAAFPDVPLEDQPTWFRQHVYKQATEIHCDADANRAVSWPEAKALTRRGHRICCHSFNHLCIRASTPIETVRKETVEARQRLEEQLGVTVDGFCWPKRHDPAALEADAIVRRNFRYALCANSRALRVGHDLHRIYRTNLEASWSREVVELQLSGLVDLKYAVENGRRRLSIDR